LRTAGERGLFLIPFRPRLPCASGDDMDVDYNMLKAEYIAGGVSLRALADKYNVSKSSLEKRAAREKWSEIKQQTGSKLAEKLAESVSDAQFKKIEALTTLMLGQLDRAVKQNDKSMMTVRTISPGADGGQVITVRQVPDKRKRIDAARLHMMSKTAKDLLDIVRSLRGDDEGREVIVRFEGDAEELSV